MAELRRGGSVKWELAGAVDASAAASISEGIGVSAAMGRLLFRRGCRTADEARAFIRMEGGILHDPFLLPDMRSAVDRIISAVKEHKKITIYGDYDADGVTSVSVLYLFLSELGADVGYYIPKRSEGYGMSKEAVDSLSRLGAGLIITVDTGTSAALEIAYANSLGVDVVVTDHHECLDTLPQAAAVVNPQRHDSVYPFSGLAGVGVVYKLVCALASEFYSLPITEATVRISEKYIDLVAIGTIADVMPVLDENRVIVSYGLRKIEKASRPGLRALMEAEASGGGERVKKKQRVTSGYISFTLAPRINAAGRMDDASLAAELFLSSDPVRAAYLAGKLCEVNRERQRIENVIAAEAIEMIEKTHDFDRDPVIVVAHKGWHPGIIGIVSSRVTERYGRPSVFITFDGDGEHDIGKGSGRSVRGLDLASALGRCGDCLVRYGGHELAAGLSVERCRLDEFRQRINDIARAELAGAEREQTVTADDRLAPDELTLKFAEELRMLEPFGAGNPTPLFITENITVIAAVGVGADKHTRLTLNTENGTITAMCFSVSPAELGVGAGDTVDLLYNIDINEFRGERSAQLIVRGVRACSADMARREEEEKLYRALRFGLAEESAEYGKYVPGRPELAAVYRAVVQKIDLGRHEHTAEEISKLAFGKSSGWVVKTRLSLDIFAEMDILSVKATDHGTYILEKTAREGKADLDRSEILSMLRRKYGG